MARKRKVLIIDDDRSLMQTLAYQLKSEGFDVVTAQDGEEGWKKIEGEKLQAVILELVLLKKDGFEILAELQRRGGDIVSLPVVVLSKLGHPDDREEAQKLGAAEYFFKGEVTLKSVVERVKGLVGSTG